MSIVKILKVGIYMQSIDRAMVIIKILVNSPTGEMTISELSKISHLPASTMHRLLKAMKKHGLIEQDESTKYYRLGSSWLEYGLRLYDTMDYVSAIRPELESLSKDLKENVYLYKLSGDESLIIERLDYMDEKKLRVTNQIGLRTPLSEGAANIAIVSKMDANKQKEIFLKMDNKKAQEYKSKISEMEKNGYVILNDEKINHTTTIAAPIVNLNQEVKGAISIIIVNFDMDEKRMLDFGQQIKNTAIRINQKLRNKTF